MMKKIRKNDENGKPESGRKRLRLRTALLLLLAAAARLSAQGAPAEAGQTEDTPEKVSRAEDPPEETRRADEAPRWNRESLLAAALRENSAYLLAASRSRESLALLSEAKAARLPTLRFGSNLSYLSNPPSLTVKAGSLYPGANIPLPIPPLYPSFPFPALPGEDITFNLSENSNYEFSLSLEQPVFTWGRIHNSVKAAELGGQAAALQVEQERRNIVTALDSRLYTLVFAAEIRELLAEQRRCAERLIDLSEESYANGFLLRADLLAARLLAAETGMADDAITEIQDNSLLAVKILSGLEDLKSPDLQLPPSGEGRESLAYVRQDKERLFSRLLAENLGLKLLALHTQVREKTLAAARGQYYGKPELGLFLQLNYGGSHFPFFQSGWKEEDKLNFTATLGIRGLIFDGGAVHQGIRQKEEALTQARLEEEKGRRGLEEYLEKTLRQLEVSRRRQEYLELKVEAAGAKKDQAESSWKSGYGEEREYLIQELSWRQEQIALLQEKLAALLISLQLENTLGL
ncbi:MAG: TolC family protein [Treponema sp.]|jgi:outer membrane protein TolC|nr:TolC family protein [Treponema sp.]